MAMPYGIQLVFVQKIAFIVSKFNKTGARASVFDSNMHQIVYQLELHAQTPSRELTALLQTS